MPEEPTYVLQPEKWVPDAAEILLNSHRAVPAYELLNLQGSVMSVSEKLLRRLYKSLRSQGYLTKALKVVENLIDTGHEGYEADLRNLRSEIGVLSGAPLEPPDLPKIDYAPEPGRAVYVTGKSVQDLDSNSTKLTQSIANLGPALGLQIFPVTQLGIGSRQTYDVDVVDEINYHRLPGPKRGEVPFGEWLSLFVKRLAAVVRKVRPAVIVASSDFVNGIAAREVARSYNVPYIYDVRGFWEDSWLKRQRASNMWENTEVHENWGDPDYWTLRKSREREVILDADAIVAGSKTISETVLDMGADGNLISVSDAESTLISAWAKAFTTVKVLPSGAYNLAEVDYDHPSYMARIQASERSPLGNVETFGGWGDSKIIRNIGWQHGTLDPVPISETFDWIAACPDHRSQNFQLHAWDFMVPFLRAWDQNRDPADLEWCLKRAISWAETFNSGKHYGTMAWYDMAIALRAPRLAYLLQEVAHEYAACKSLDILTQAIVIHQRALFSARAFNENNNHGFYTAAGQLSFAARLTGLPGMDIIRKQGAQRMKLVSSTQFSPEGVHTEHSPDYHRMVLSSFIGALDDGLIDDPEVQERLQKALEVMSWFLRPDGTIVQIGDSPERSAALADRAMAHPYTRFLVSKGRQGEPNPDEFIFLKESGYSIVRSPQPVGRTDAISAGYLTFMGAFHSRVHKHCDDLSLTWFDSGQEILVDSGRYGYLSPLPADSELRKIGFFYGDEKRQYVERVIAHNTVQRQDEEYDRKNLPPYGSAIESTAKNLGVFDLKGHVDHGSWTHTRKIKYTPGEWLLVTDNVSMPHEDERDFTVWWNLSESFGPPEVEDNCIIWSLPTGRRLYVTTYSGDQLVPPVIGELNPMRGWRSKQDYELSECWSFGFSNRVQSDHEFQTVFSFDSQIDVASLTPN